MNTPIGGAPPADTTPPTISAVTATSITASGATITWTTNEAADSQVEYGTTTAYGSVSPLDSALVTSHSVAISSLSADTTYNFRVKSKDAAGNLTTSANFTFTATTASPTGGPAATYAFNESAGTSGADSSGNNNTGTLTNGATWTPGGKFGSAINFDGLDDYVSVPDAASLDLAGSGTMEAWIKRDALGTWDSIIAKGAANFNPAHNYALEIDAANRVECILGNGAAANVLFSATTFTDTTQFHHLACTWDGATIRLYLDGVLNNSASQTLTPAANTSALFIGQFGGNADPFDGIIDEVRIYSRAFTEAEIQTHMNTPISP